MTHCITRIVSGGQTGVDRAALDIGLALGIPIGGWCPQGRRAEDGPIDPRYPLCETPSADYAQRTEWNARDSDGTLILTRGRPSGGTAQTIAYAILHGKPHLIVNLTATPDPAAARAWLSQYAVRTLNVAGPRESKQPGIYRQAAQWLRMLLKPSARTRRTANAARSRRQHGGRRSS